MTVSVQEFHSKACCDKLSMTIQPTSESTPSTQPTNHGSQFSTSPWSIGLQRCRQNQRSESFAQAMGEDIDSIPLRTVNQSTEPNSLSLILNSFGHKLFQSKLLRAGDNLTERFEDRKIKRISHHQLQRRPNVAGSLTKFLGHKIFRSTPLRREPV